LVSFSVGSCYFKYISANILVDVHS